jgi:hypothetical protein
MSTIRPGNTYTEPVTSIVDGSGNPFNLAGTTVTLTVRNLRGTVELTHTLVINNLGDVLISDGLALQSTMEAGVVVNTLSAVETAALSDGWYRWQVQLTDSTGNTWDVDEGAWEVRSSTQYVVRNGVTRREIRRRILGKLGDLVIVQATDAGSLSTMIDRIRLTGEPDAYRGRQIMLTGGTVANLGEQRYVTGSSRTNRSLTVDYDFPAETAVGDEAELINTHGTGYRFDDVAIAIDAAVESASNMAREPVVLDVTDTYNRATGDLTIPDDWVAVTGVDWRNSSDEPWNALEMAGKRLSSGWGVDRARRLITISGERSLYLDTKAVRIYGLRKPQPIPNDDDVTGINAEWLVARAVSELSSASYRKNPTPEKRDMLSFDLENERIIRTRVTQRSGMGSGVFRL